MDSRKYIITNGTFEATHYSVASKVPFIYEWGFWSKSSVFGAKFAGVLLQPCEYGAIARLKLQGCGNNEDKQPITTV